MPPNLYDTPYEPLKIGGKGEPNRRESVRQKKKPKRDLPDEQGNVSDASVSSCDSFVALFSLFLLTINPNI